MGLVSPESSMAAAAAAAAAAVALHQQHQEQKDCIERPIPPTMRMPPSSMANAGMTGIGMLPNVSSAASSLASYQTNITSSTAKVNYEYSIQHSYMNNGCTI